jgi:tetratricopeptide (TPR) repeat protein
MVYSAAAMRRILLCAAIVTVAASAWGQVPPADVQFRDAYRIMLLADSAYDRQDMPKARELYEEALNAYNLLQRTYPEWQSGVTDFRIRHCTRRLESLRSVKPATSLPPELPAPPPVSLPSETVEPPLTGLAALIDAGRKQLQAGKPENARRLLLDALKVNPDHATTRLLLALAQCQTGQLDDAVRLLDNLINDQPANARAYLYRSTARLGTGKTAEAIADLEMAVRFDPKLAVAYYDLAQAHLLKTPPDKAAAQTAYRRAVELGASPDAALEAQFKSAEK